MADDRALALFEELVTLVLADSGLSQETRADLQAGLFDLRRMIKDTAHADDASGAALSAEGTQ